MWTVAGAVMFVIASALNAMTIRERLRYDRSFQDASVLTRGAHPTMGFYLSTYSGFFSFGVAEMLVGVWWIYMAHPKGARAHTCARSRAAHLLEHAISRLTHHPHARPGPFNLAYGFIFSMPVLFLGLVGRERVFHFSARQFDAESAQV